MSSPRPGSIPHNDYTTLNTPPANSSYNRGENSASKYDILRGKKIVPTRKSSSSESAISTASSGLFSSIPGIPTEFVFDREKNHHVANIEGITTEDIQESQQERREAMIRTRAAHAAATFCARIRSWAHRNDFLNQAEGAIGRLAFDKFGDMINSREVNLEIERVPFGEPMRRAYFDHLKGTHFNSASYGCAPSVLAKARAELLPVMQSNNVLWRFKTVPFRVRQTEYALAKFLRTDPDDVVLVPTSHYGINAVLKSQPWAAGDILMLLSTDSEATFAAAGYLRWRMAITVHIVDIPLPTTAANILRRVRGELVNMKAVDKGLPVLASFQHVTAESGFVFPAQKLVQLFHDFGVSVMVDGAHAAGQIALNISSIGADYYVGTMHKWMYAQPSTAFLIVDPCKQSLIQPLVVSYFYGDSYTKAFSYTGHMDFTGYITAQYALDFIKEACGGFKKIRRYREGLARRVVALLKAKWNTRVCQKHHENYGSMPIMELPPHLSSPGGPTTLDAATLMFALLEAHEMTTLVYVEEFFGIRLLVMRLSVQIWHELNDFDRLAEAVNVIDPAWFLANRRSEIEPFMERQIM